MDLRYSGYIQWKGWLEERPSGLADQHDAFEREFRDVGMVNRRIHELGFGEGHFLDWARSKGARVSGVELDACLVDAATKRGHDVQVVAPGGAIGNIEPGELDIVVAFDVLEHLKKEEIQVLAVQVATALRWGGTFLARFPNGASPFSGPYQYGDATHETQLTAGAVEQLVSFSQLRLIGSRNAARPMSGKVSKRLVRGLRYAAQSVVGAGLSVTYYGRLLPMDPNITVVLRKEHSLS